MSQHNSVPTKQPVLNGKVAALLTFVVNFNSVDAAGNPISGGIKLFTMRGALGSTVHPVLLEIWAEVVTAFNATSTNVLTAGSDQASANQYLGSSDITEGTPGFYPASNAKKMVTLRADTDFWVKYTQTGTAATTGQAVIYVRVTPLSPINSSQLGV